MNSALERLRALRAGKSAEVDEVDAIPMEWRYEFEERAAILEYDGGLSREEADRQAFVEMQKRMETPTGTNKNVTG